MRRVFSRMMLAVVLVGASPVGALWAGLSVSRPAIQCWQYGIPTMVITAGDPLQVRGAGFAGSLPVSVCFSGALCLHSDVDASGAFAQNRVIRAPGKYLITVRQARSRDLEHWILRASLQVKVEP